MTQPEALRTHQGGCHCGAVRFRVTTPGRITLHRCNCSICAACGFLHLIVPAARFELLTDAAALTDYQFGTRTAHHLFCSVCGVKSYYVPRSNPDGFSVNFNCLVDPRFDEVTIEDFDGQNWEREASRLAGLSRSD